MWEYFPLWRRISSRSFTKGNQLCWQKQLILLSPPSHPTSSVYPTQTHTYIHAHTNTLTEARQWILSVLINGYIFQAADVAASARSEHGWSGDVLPLNNIKSNWTLTPLRAPREGARGGTAGAGMLCNARETEWQCECDEQIRRNEKKQTTQQFHHVCDVCALICVRSSFSLAYVCWKGLILSRRILAGFDLQSSVVLPTLHVCLVLFPSPDLKSKRKCSQEQIRVFKLSLFISVSENEYVIWCVWSTDTSHTITCTCALEFSTISHVIQPLWEKCEWVLVSVPQTFAHQQHAGGWKTWTSLQKLASALLVVTQKQWNASWKRRMFAFKEKAGPQRCSQHGPNLTLKALKID